MLYINVKIWLNIGGMEKDMKKILELLSRGQVKVVKNEGKHTFQRMGLPPLNLLLKRANPGPLPLKPMKKIPLDGDDPTHRTAIDADRCCQEQELHLLNLKKIYEEKSHPLKRAKKWKLQKFQVAQMQPAELTELKKHTIKKINEKSSQVPQS